ncbi:MAG: TetR/AcrR family transcriptional regulator [Lactobacillus sp.]
MVKATFKNLAADKQERIVTALLTEFGEYPLAEAQVARIIKTAEIARGAFYKYFDDLTDAYRYVYGLAMREVHQGINMHDFSARGIYQQVADFVTQAQASRYYQLVKMHLAYNESLVGAISSAQSDRIRQLPAKVWAGMVLSHAAIKLALLDPEHRTTNLARFKESLALLDKE